MSLVLRSGVSKTHVLAMKRLPRDQLTDAHDERRSDRFFADARLRFPNRSTALEIPTRCGVLRILRLVSYSALLSGIATPKEDIDIIRARLKVAEALAKELRNGKTHH